MYYVYLLKARNTNWIYVGYTNNLEQRLNEHKARRSITTSRLGPMELAYYEAYRSIDDAKERERQLKNYGSALGHLKRRAKRSLVSAGYDPAVTTVTTH